MCGYKRVGRGRPSHRPSPTQPRLHEYVDSRGRPSDPTWGHLHCHLKCNILKFKILHLLEFLDSRGVSSLANSLM